MVEWYIATIACKQWQAKPSEDMELRDKSNFSNLEILFKKDKFKKLLLLDLVELYDVFILDFNLKNI